MADSRVEDPRPVHGLVDIPRLALRLGVGQSAIRNWLARDVPFLPEPVGQLHGWVWTEESLIGIEDRRRSSGRPRTKPVQAAEETTDEPPTGQDELRPVVHSKSASVGREPGVHQHEFVFDRGTRRWSYE